MYPDFSGLAYLAMIGLGAVVIATTALPVAFLWGLAWLLEPKAGASVWIIQEWLSAIWVLACLAFFGSALVYPLIARIGR